MSLSTEANERLYDALAEAIDRAGPEGEALFLTKLVLLLARSSPQRRCGDGGDLRVRRVDIRADFEVIV